MRKVPLLVAAGALLAPHLPAQLGRLSGLRVDAQAAAGASFSGMLGVQVVGNRYFVTGSRDAAGNPHRLFEFAGNGALVASHPQPAATATSAWGIRDMAYDGRYVWGGLEGNTLHAFDPASNTYLAGTITVGAGPTLIRALAYNPNGDNGRGSFWTGNFYENVYEFDRSGNILTTVANPNNTGPFGAVYGAAYDPGEDTVWWFSQGRAGGAAPFPPQSGPGGQIVWVEMSASGPNKGMPTGQMHLGDSGIVPSVGIPAGGTAGGCDFHLKNGTTPTLVALAQAASDTFYEQAGRYDRVGCQPSGTLRTGGGIPLVGPLGNASFRIEVAGLPANVTLAALGLAGPGSIPPFPPLLPCGAAVGIGTLIVLGMAPVAGGSASLPLPIPDGTSIRKQTAVEALAMLIDLGPPSVFTSRITLVLTF